MIENKIVNQPLSRLMSMDKTLCGKCSTLIDTPTRDRITTEDCDSYIIYHYIGTPHFIHETKSGYAITYCSEYCMKQHNHRFRK